MNTKTQSLPPRMPLVDRPISRDYVIPGPQSELTVTITACPSQRVQYKFAWTRRPPAGTTARCSGQVTLRRGTSNFGDTLRTVSTDSGGAIYAGIVENGLSVQNLRHYQLHDVDDFDFSGKILEMA